MTSKRGASAFVFFLLTLCIFIVLISDTETAILHVRNGITLCFKVVVPSLFPFMVLSGLFVELGCADVLSKMFAAPMRAIFGISGAGAAAPIMGALCGFPVGASVAHRLFKCGRISKSELQRLLTFSNIPGSAFLISAVGWSLWSSTHFGTVLYIIQILSALLIGLFLRILYPLPKNDRSEIRPSDVSFGIGNFLRVVSESSVSMLNVCALVLFFAAFVGALVSILGRFDLGQDAIAVIYGFFEMSGAVGAAALVPSRELGMVLTALICGWSGLSIHFQVISICEQDGISFVPYFAAKAVQGILSALFMLIYIRFINKSLPYLCLPTIFVDGHSLGNTAFAFVTNAVMLTGVFITHPLCLFSRARKK